MIPDLDPDDEDDDEYIPWDVDRVYDFGDFEDDSDDEP